MLPTATYACPHCGETVETLLDPDTAGDSLIEDCPVCCRPIVLTVAIDDQGGVRLAEVRPENE